MSARLDAPGLTGAALAAALLALALGMGALEPLFAALFPALERPVYRQDSFIVLLGWHVALVAASSAAAALLGIGAGIWVTRQAGRAWRGPVEALAAAAQTVPPVAVLAIAVPLMGYGPAPVILALLLYGLLPILRGTVAGIESVPPGVLEAAVGAGMGERQVLWRVELPLAAPQLVAAVRSSVLINIGTAAIAATVGVRTLGSPIIVGLAGFNTAYLIQGALLTALLALAVDQAFAQAARRVGVPPSIGAA
jgi:osmoprotectant transport system permease protein